MIQGWFKVLFFALCTVSLSGQGVVFQEYDWDGVLHAAATQDKPIFVDVYTTWCAPCIRMDKTTFVDSAVGRYYNDNFISIKINAEDNGKGTFIANRFDVGSYPTLLFLSSAGEIIRQEIGMQNKYDLLRKGQSALDIYESFDYLKSVKTNIYKDYSQEELAKILTISYEHSFSGKEVLAMKYLDGVDAISEADLKMVMGEVKSMDLEHVRRLAPMTTSLSYDEMRVRRNAKEWISWRNDTELSINEYVNNAINEKDFSTFEKGIEVLRATRAIQPKQIDKLYYKYYRRNDLEQFKMFASYMINEYIIPSRPEDVAVADREKYKLLYNEVMSGMARLEDSNVTIEGQDEATKTPTIDSIAEIYTISRSIAEELFEVSSDFSAFYEDESSQRKADFWASLTYKYYPYELKYFDNHIYILKTIGKEAEAREVEAEMKALPYYQEMKTAAASAW